MADTPQSGQLAVRLVTPDRVLLDATADAVELPSMSGYLEALYGHAPLLAELGAGDVTLHGASGGENAARSDRYNVSWGFVEVLPDRVTILANGAIAPAEIDTARAQEELNHGHELWNQAGDDPEKYEIANHVIHEAEAKLASAGSTGQH